MRLMLRWMVLACAISSAANAQCEPLRPPGPCDALIADLGLFVVGVGYERAILPRVSVQIQAQYYRPWPIHLDVSGVGGQLRLYAFLGDGRSLSGPYLSPFVRVGYVRADGMNGDDIALTAGLTAGLSFAIDAVLLRVGAGAQWLSYAIGTDRVFRGLYPTIDLVIGLGL